MSKIIRAEVDILGNPQSFPVQMYLPDDFNQTGRSYKIIFIIGENVFYENAGGAANRGSARNAGRATREPREACQESIPAITPDSFEARDANCLRVKEGLDILAEGQQDAVVAAIEISELERFFAPTQRGFARKNTAEETAPEFVVSSLIPNIRAQFGIKSGATNAALCAFGTNIGFALECASLAAPVKEPPFSHVSLILPAPKPDGGRRLFKRIAEMRLSENQRIKIFAANKLEQNRRLRKISSKTLDFAFKLSARLSDSGAHAKLELDFDRGNTTFDKSLLFFDFAAGFFIPDIARSITPSASYEAVGGKNARRKTAAKR